MRWGRGWVKGICLLLAVPPLLTIYDQTSHLDSSAPTNSLWKGLAFNEPTNVCPIDPGTEPFPDRGYCFVKGLIHPDTGLPRSRETECFTKVYKIALVAMAFIHQGDIAGAERIFNFFQSRLSDPFPGFREVWDPCLGQPDDSSDYWEGDNAFLLLALNYYAHVTGGYGSYYDLADALRDWLTERAHSDEKIRAEGVANMYAALEPFGGDWENWKTLSRLYDRFYSEPDPGYRVDYPGVADHAVRGALVFGDTTGFEYLDNFRRTEIWQCDESTEVRAYAGFSWEDPINVEISAQLLLAWELWKHHLEVDLSSLRSELEKLRLLSEKDPMCSGLPYRVREVGEFNDEYSLPIVDPTVYLLYDYWSFNPFAPGRRNAGCHYDKFLSLETEGQQQDFPRLFTVHEDPISEFPQEINDGVHKNIVIQFTLTSTQSLLTNPLTLTIDTVDREGSGFGLLVKLDNGDHCLVGLEPSATYDDPDGEEEVATIPLIAEPVPMPYRVYLPIVTGTGAPSHPARLYQLVLEGERGWGVFDWLQLETPDEVLWTIGYDDNRCSEFDNDGFVYPCS